MLYLNGDTDPRFSYERIIMKKIYVITGATSGIGKALTEYFAEENTVFAGYRDEKKLSGLPKSVIPFYINSTDSASIAQAAEFIQSKTDKINTLINVAGCVVAGVMEHISTDELRRQFEVNVFAHIDLSQRLLGLLDGGRIINISSMSSFGIFPFIAPYAASKRALDIMFNAMALEMKKNIKVISIKPGVIATPLWEKSIKENESAFSSCLEYDKEINFMVKNAKSNGVKGLAVEKVVEVIAKADSSKDPRPSYTVGIDAKAAELISHLPQGVLNKIIKFKLAQKL